MENNQSEEVEVQIEKDALGNDTLCFRRNRTHLGVLHFGFAIRKAKFKQILSEEMAVIFHDLNVVSIDLPLKNGKSAKLLISQLSFNNLNEAAGEKMISLECRDISHKDGKPVFERTIKIPRYTPVELNSFAQIKANDKSFAAFVAIDFKRKTSNYVNKTVVARIYCTAEDLDLIEEISFDPELLETGKKFLKKTSV